MSETKPKEKNRAPAKPKGKIFSAVADDGQQLSIVDLEQIEGTGAVLAWIVDRGTVLKKGAQHKEANIFKVKTVRNKNKNAGPHKVYNMVRNEQGAFKPYNPSKVAKDPATTTTTTKKRAKPDAGDKTERKKKKKAAPKKIKTDGLNATQLAQIMAIMQAGK